MERCMRKAIPLSFELSIIGYIKDVVAQMKRGLDGFWVAHPNLFASGLHSLPLGDDTRQILKMTLLNDW